MATRSRQDTALVAVPAADLSALLAEVRELRAEVRELRDAQPVEWMTPAEAGEVLGVSAGVLANWRYEQRGPSYVRVGRVIRYDRRAVDEWLLRHVETPASA